MTQMSWWFACTWRQYQWLHVKTMGRCAIHGVVTLSYNLPCPECLI